MTQGILFETITPRVQDLVIPARASKQAEQCRKAADALQRDIEKKYSSARSMRSLPPTRKRTQDSQGIFNDGVRLEKFQRLLRTLAEQHDTGSIQDEVKHITSRAAMEREAYSNARLRLMLQCCDRPETREEKCQRLERGFMLQDIPGFFPTPRDVADEIVSLLGPITPQDLILEPGAGTGSLIDAALRVQPDVKVQYFEQNYSLCDFLQSKYDSFNIGWVGRDFTEVDAKCYAPRYSAVLMNPPFENGQDGEHVQRAYELLAPGGRMAAIVGSGILHRSDKKALAFQAFLEYAGSRVTKLPDGAFKSSGTGTNCHTVYIRK